MAPRIFISYSWSTSTHEDWVILLAQRIVGDGIDVVIDKWDLKEGHDKYNFMESMVRSNDINKVLIILDKKYAEKANDRVGGVGTETQIISPNIYEDLAQEKFIPIIAELDEEGKPYIPIFLKGRVYIDLSLDEHFEINYERLLRNILNRPSLTKPKLGIPPQYLFDETPVNYKTTTILRGFDAQVDKNPNRINSITKDFLSEFYDNLKDFRILKSERGSLELGKLIYENLAQYSTLRNDYILFIDKVSKIENDFDFDIIIRFLEKLTLFHHPPKGVNSYIDSDFDNFKFIITELFIHTVAVLLKNENYFFLTEIFQTRYFLTKRHTVSNEPDTYQGFYSSIDSMDKYLDQQNGNKLHNPSIDLMIKRLPETLSKKDFVDADLLCYYVGLIINIRWFPQTYVYKDEDSKVFAFFNRLISKKHFDKIKSIFNVNTPEELQILLKTIKQKEDNRMRYPNAWSSVLPLSNYINEDLIATSR